MKFYSGQVHCSDLTYTQWERRQDAKRSAEWVIRMDICDEMMRRVGNDNRLTAECCRDHNEVVKAIRCWCSWDILEQMPELNRWPETRCWLKCALEDERL